MSPGIHKTVAAAVALSCGAAALTACSSLGLGGDREPALEPALSRNEAGRVLNEFVTRVNATMKTRDSAALGRYETVPQLPLDTGKYKIAEFHRKARKQQLRPLGFERPAFYIPRMEGHPRWFSAIAAPVEGGPVQAMIFVRAGEKQPWQLAYGTALGGGRGEAADTSGRLRIAVDRKGASFAVPTGDDQTGGTANSPPASDDNAGDGTGDNSDSDSHTGAGGGGRPPTRPSQLPDAHASINQYGAAGFGNSVLSAGQWTTGVADTVTRDVREAKRKGYNYARIYHASGFPSYALRTADGGAVVWYTVTDELSVSRARPRPGTTLRIASDMAGIIRRSKVIDTFQVSSLNQYVAVVPPQGGRAEVIGASGGPVGGVGR